jgi:D-glycero-alpha-D-manno-heptose 1-phosphate guanylyltransferase
MLINSTTAIMLVGGLGTRLRPVVSSQPKVLASIGDRSFLELLVGQLRSQGVRKIVMCTGYLADQIQDRFGDGSGWNVSIAYSKEDSPMGTAGALSLARRYVEGASEFVVLNGDSFLQVDLQDLIDFHRAQPDAVATIGVVRVEDAGRYGTVSADSSGKIVHFAEKTGTSAPGLINGGIYVFSGKVWEYVPEGPASLEKDVFPRLLERGLYAKEQRGLFIDIGTPTDYARAQELLRSV